MEANQTIRLGLIALFAPLLLSGCVSDGMNSAVSTEGAQPRRATWRCDGGTTMTVINNGSSIHVLSPRGTEVDLPASPPGSRTRYGEGLYAVVFEGREALWFVTGKQPLNCRR